MTRPAPYCSPQMLTMLRTLDERKPIKVTTRSAVTRANLRSRGWITEDNQVTPAGRQWLEVQNANA